MFTDDIVRIYHEFGPDIKVSEAVHIMDEDEWNKTTVSYKGIIVGSELVSYEFMKRNIENTKRRFEQ